MPQIDEGHFEMNLERTYLAVDTELTNPRQEVVFWCRGSELEIEVALDGKPLEGLVLGEGGDRVDLPVTAREVRDSRAAQGKRTLGRTRGSQNSGWRRVLGTLFPW